MCPPILWDKILYNAAAESPGAGARVHHMAGSPENTETRRLMDRIIDEVFRVAQAHNIPLNWKTPKSTAAFLHPACAAHGKAFPVHVLRCQGRQAARDRRIERGHRQLAQERISVPVNETMTALDQGPKKRLQREAVMSAR